MAQLLDSPVLPVNHASPPKKPVKNFESRGILQSFKIFFNTNHEPISYSSFLTLDETIYTQALTQLSSDSTRGIIVIDDKVWYYERQAIFDFFQKQPMNSIAITNFPPATSYQIALLDVTASTIVLRDLSLSLLAVSGLMFFIILAISYYFTKQAIKPVQLSFEKQQQFIADASHELKTPLAIISANTDALFAHQDDTIANQLQWLMHIQNQSHRMNKLINDLLILAKNETPSRSLLHSTFDCSQALKQIISEFEVLSFEKGLTIEENIEADIFLNGDTDSFQQFCFIFLDNALKYTQNPGTITIHLTRQQQTATLTISNTFPTLSDVEISKFFDRFYRADSARTYNGSYGLGLAIAQQLSQQLHAQIHTSSANDILSFTINFPCKA
ncbi:MAG: sensor histidine kinase [Culicoidibacterales bacterium]